MTDMARVQSRIPRLSAGDHLSWEEFELRWEAMPEVKFAELIGGKVFMPSPLSEFHGGTDAEVMGCLAYYAGRTPGTSVVSQATCRMLDDAPQPDAALRIREEYGGRSHVKGLYLTGAPELIVEVCLSSAAYDLHEKRDLYEMAGVIEYVTVLLHEGEIRWHRLDGGEYRLLSSGPDGCFRSTVFPGLWLNAASLLNRDLAGLLDTVERGVASPEHAEFCNDLLARRQG